MNKKPLSDIFFFSNLYIFKFIDTTISPRLDSSEFLVLRLKVGLIYPRGLVIYYRETLGHFEILFLKYDGKSIYWLILKLELTPWSQVSPTYNLVCLILSLFFGENGPRKMAEQSTRINKILCMNWNFWTH